jgi:flagellar biosynthesis/type III secretory pathway protein FliH
MAKRLSSAEWEREADRLMQEERDKAYQEGYQEAYQEAARTWIKAMLMVKFGSIDPELEAIIPKLMNMDPTERSRLILTLSREALLLTKRPSR